MNKIIYIISILLVGCVSGKTNIKTFNTNESIILRYNYKYNYVYRINFPIGLALINNSVLNKPFLTINYKYSPYIKGLGEDLYGFNSNRKRIINNEKKYIEAFKKRKILLFSWYKLDTSKVIQQHFKPYVEKMLAKNQDTLHIGTVADFKQKHKELFKKLTKNDSISIQFLDNDKLGERITVPVKWD